VKKVPVPLGMDIIAPCLMIGLAFGRIGCFLNGCCYGAECQTAWAVQFPYFSDAYVTEFDQNVLKQAVPRDLLRPDHEKLADYMTEHNMESLQEPIDRELFAKLEVAGSLRTIDGVNKGSHLKQLAAQQKANAVHPAEIFSAVTAILICAFCLAYFTLPHVPGRVFAAMMIIEGAFRYLLEMLRVEPALVGRGTAYFPTLPPQSFEHDDQFRVGDRRNDFVVDVWECSHETRGAVIGRCKRRAGMMDRPRVAYSSSAPPRQAAKNVIHAANEMSGFSAMLVWLCQFRVRLREICSIQFWALPALPSRFVRQTLLPPAPTAASFIGYVPIEQIIPLFVTKIPGREAGVRLPEIGALAKAAHGRFCT